MPYDRAVLAEVVVYHHKVRIEGCLCGWSELGRSIGEHVADVYEQSVAARMGGEVAGRTLSRREQLSEALHDAYKPDGVAIWWQAWERADDEKRAYMERMILADGNCS